jgi:hypothetical protein
VADALAGAPITNGMRGKLAVVSKKRFKAERSLDFKVGQPVLKNDGCLSFRAKGKRPDVTAIIINDVHKVHMTRTRSDRKGTTQVNINTFKLYSSPKTLPYFWNRRTSLLSENAMFTFRWFTGSIDRHTFSNLRTSHIKDGTRATVS